jgi:hypothetical protein
MAQATLASTAFVTVRPTSTVFVLVIVDPSYFSHPYFSNSQRGPLQIRITIWTIIWTCSRCRCINYRASLLGPVSNLCREIISYHRSPCSSCISRIVLLLGLITESVLMKRSLFHTFFEVILAGPRGLPCPLVQVVVVIMPRRFPNTKRLYI